VAGGRWALLSRSEAGGWFNAEYLPQLAASWRPSWTSGTRRVGCCSNCPRGPCNWTWRSSTTTAGCRCEGKARKQRAVPLTSPVQTLLRLWLSERAGHANDPLFPTRTGRRLSRDAVALRVSTHAATAAQHCPSLLGKKIHPPVLRHSCAMSLLHAGVDTSVIALWLGHTGVRSTDAYVHADITIKEKALARTTPASARPGRYRPPDKTLAFLEGL
jgi:Phage integrase family